MANGGEFCEIMAEKKLPKGILKTSSSFDKQEKPSKKSLSKATKWDEMNIIATLHPADKDYGHMKIEEPKTPYNYEATEEDEVDGTHQLNPDELMEKLRGSGSPSRRSFSSNASEDSEESDQDVPPEEIARRKMFQSKRKIHYNEFKVVELARKLIKADEDELDEEDEDREENLNDAGPSSTSEPTAPSESSSRSPTSTSKK